MINKDDTYLIGRITKAHALKGEVVFTFSDDIFDRTECPYLICEIEGILVPFFMEEYRFKSDSTALVKFEDIDTVEQTQQIIGANVFFEKKYIEEGDEEEVSLTYFIGFTIKEENRIVGTITYIDDKTENYLFIVERPDGKECMIPAHEEFIIDIDHKNKTIEMNLPAGLLDL